MFFFGSLLQKYTFATQNGTQIKVNYGTTSYIKGV